MNCPSCSKAVSGVYEAGSYSCSGCGAGIQVNPARAKHVQFGTEGANKRWGKTTATKKKTAKKKTSKNPGMYQVIVGNIGTVYDGKSRDEAEVAYNEYVEQSKSGYGYAGNEAVTLWMDSFPIEEHFPEGDDEDYDNPARAKHVQFGTEGANKRWGKSKATGTKKKTKKNPSFEYPPHASPEFPGEGAGYARSQSGAPSYSAGQSATRNPDFDYHKLMAIQSAKLVADYAASGFERGRIAASSQQHHEEEEAARSGMGGQFDEEGNYYAPHWRTPHGLPYALRKEDVREATKLAAKERAGNHPLWVTQGAERRGLSSPIGNPRRMDYAVFVPAGEAASGGFRWAMQSEGFRQESSFASAAWWTRVTTKKEALRLGKKFFGLVTEKPDVGGGAYDGPTFRMTSTVVKDFRTAKSGRRRAEPGSDPMFANPPFAEHELEAKEKHWALEDNPAEDMNCSICNKSLMRGDYIYGACSACARKAIIKASKKASK